jgi:hypothetical protein
VFLRIKKRIFSDSARFFQDAHPQEHPMFSNLSRRQCILGAAALLVSGASHALDAPKGKVILSITGNIQFKNADDRADFDMDMLAALPQQNFTTSTPWFKESKKFTGPLLRDVLAAAGAKGSTLKAVALNDFKVEIPVSDTRQFPMLLARLMDDKPMPTREKGPLFIIYPFDTIPEIQSARYYSRSAWQLRTLEVQ